MYLLFITLITYHSAFVKPFFITFGVSFSRAVSSSCIESITAIIPATWEDAMEVPLIIAILPPGAVESILSACENYMKDVICNNNKHVVVLWKNTKFKILSEMIDCKKNFIERNA